MFNFHGICGGCDLQDDSLANCIGCRYFECDWALPDKNPRHAREKEERARVVAKAYRLHAARTAQAEQKETDG